MDLSDIMELDDVRDLVTAIISGIVLLGLWLLWRAVKGRLERVLGQTENSHEDMEYPNLRDEVTAIRLLAEQAATTGKETAEAVGLLADAVGNDRAASRRETEGVREDVRSLSGRLDLHIATSVTRQADPPEST